MKKKLLILLSLLLVFTLFIGCDKTEDTFNVEGLISTEDLKDIEDVEKTEVVENEDSANTDETEATEEVGSDGLDVPDDYTKAVSNPYGIQVISYDHVSKSTYGTEIVLELKTYLTQDIGKEELVTFIPVGLPEGKTLESREDNVSLLPKSESDPENEFIYETYFEDDEYITFQGNRENFPFFMVTLKPIFEKAINLEITPLLTRDMPKDRSEEDLVAVVSIDDDITIPNIAIYQYIGEGSIITEYLYYDFSAKNWYTLKYTDEKF